MNLIDLFLKEGKQYLMDAMPGGALNREVTPQGLLDATALATAPVPVVGDVAGLAADAKRMYDNPAERTAANFGLAGLGLIPFIPSMGTVKNVAENMPSLKALQGEYYDATAKANELYGILRGGNKDPQVLEQYKQVSARRDELYPQVFPKTPEPEPQGLMGAVNDYRGQHVAPTKDSGAPLWKLEDVYPEDFYSASGARFYGDGAEPMRDARIVSMMQSMRGKPNAPVTVYRAVPKSVDSKKALNAGDWVTIDRQYAKEHGEGALQGDYKIVKKTVKARDLFTNADSIYEMGYDPQAMMRRK